MRSEIQCVGLERIWTCDSRAKIGERSRIHLSMIPVKSFFKTCTAATCSIKGVLSFRMCSLCQNG